MYLRTLTSDSGIIMYFLDVGGRIRLCSFGTVRVKTSLEFSKYAVDSALINPELFQTKRARRCQEEV